MFRPVKVKQYLALMKSRGIDPQDVLLGTSLTEEMLSRSDVLLDVEQAREVVSNLIRLTGDQGIGLEFGAKTEMLDLGLVGYLMLSAKTAREAMKYWLDYSNALVGMPIRLMLDEQDAKEWSLTFEQGTPLGFIYNFFVEEQLVMIHKLGGELADTIPLPTRLELSYPAPAHHEVYLRYFQCPIEFNSRLTRITYAKPKLGQPLRGNDPEFNELCERQCEMLMTQIGQNGPIVSRIRAILMRSRCVIPSIVEIAHDVQLSPRTLRRHLNREGTNYQQLVNEFRVDMAREYLRSASITTKEIAYLLGFKDTNSFRRSFKAWTGKTIREYR